MERVRRPLWWASQDAERPVAADSNRTRPHPPEPIVVEIPEPVVQEVKAEEKPTAERGYKGDYLNVPSDTFLMKILEKHGDGKILFADSVLKFTGSGKVKRRGLLITEVCIYIVDLEASLLKRRIPLSLVDKLCLSVFGDNFFSLIIPKEYDCLMASTRKDEILTVLVDATKNRPNSEIKVSFTTRFEYRASASTVKEVLFEEVDGGVRTKIVKM